MWPQSFPFPEWVCRWWVRNVWASVPLCLQTLVTHSGSTNTAILPHAFSIAGRYWRRKVKAQTGWHIWVMRAYLKQRPGWHHVSAWLALRRTAHSPGSAGERRTYSKQKTKPGHPCDSRVVSVPPSGQDLNKIWFVFLVSVTSWTQHSTSGMTQNHLGLTEPHKNSGPNSQGKKKIKETYTQTHMILYIISGGSRAFHFSKILVTTSQCSLKQNYRWRQKYYN